MVILRDGRKLIGVFRSYDQFGESHPAFHITYHISHHTRIRGQARSENVLMVNLANFLLESTIERLHHKQEFADRDLGEQGDGFVELGGVLSDGD